MIDFHTHILPEIDDGAKNVEESLSMLNSLSETGIKQVLLSPHYYPDKESIEEFTARRQVSCEKLASAVKSAKFSVPQLHVAAEVYLDPALMSCFDYTPLTVDSGGKFMLTELLYEPKMSLTSESMLRHLIYSYDIIPILAHIERYPFLLKEKNLYALLELGCVAQINVSSLLHCKIRKVLIKYLKKGYIGAIASDIHNVKQIKSVKQGLSKLSEESLKYITGVSRGIINNAKKDSNGFHDETVVV